MKTFTLPLVVILTLAFSTKSSAQNVAINATGSNADAIANNGSLSTVYIDMGINSQGYNSGSNILNKANTAYLYATGRDFYIGSGATVRYLIFYTNNSGTTGCLCNTTYK